jgi:hypothetical protein
MEARKIKDINKAITKEVRTHKKTDYLKIDHHLFQSTAHHMLDRYSTAQREQGAVGPIVSNGQMTENTNPGVNDEELPDPFAELAIPRRKPS